MLALSDLFCAVCCRRRRGDDFAESQGLIWRCEGGRRRSLTEVLPKICEDMPFSEDAATAPLFTRESVLNPWDVVSGRLAPFEGSLELQSRLWQQCLSTTSLEDRQHHQLLSCAPRLGEWTATCTSACHPPQLPSSR